MKQNVHFKLHTIKESFQSFNDIKSAIQCFNGNEFSKSELKYIKKTTTSISQLVQYCQNFVTTHKWKFEIEFTNGMMSSLKFVSTLVFSIIKVLSRSTYC